MGVGGGRSGGGGVIRWKRLWSVTFKRWATLQGTSARTHTHWNAHTQTTVSSYLLMSRQADRRREEVNGRVESEINTSRWDGSLLSLWRKLCTQVTVKTLRYFWMTHTNTQTIIIPLFYSALSFYPPPPSLCLFRSILHPLIKNRRLSAGRKQTLSISKSWICGQIWQRTTERGQCVHVVRATCTTMQQWVFLNLSYTITTPPSHHSHWASHAHTHSTQIHTDTGDFTNTTAFRHVIVWQHDSRLHLTHHYTHTNLYIQTENVM